MVKRKANFKKSPKVPAFFKLFLPIKIKMMKKIEQKVSKTIFSKFIA